MDLVDEEDGALSRPLTLAGALNDLPELGHTAEHRIQALKAVGGAQRDDMGQGRFARAGRAPQDHRGQTIGVDGSRQRPVGTEQMILTGHVSEELGPQAIRQGPHARGARRRIGRRRGLVEAARPE